MVHQFIHDNGNFENWDIVRLLGQHTAAGASDMVKAIDGVFAQVELGLEARVKALVRHQEYFEGRGTLVHRASDVLVGTRRRAAH